MNIREELTRLVALQEAESVRRELEAELASFPAERDRLRRRIAVAEQAVAEAAALGEASVKERRRLEGELQTAEAQIDKYRDQEMRVKRNEELWAVQKEIATVQEKIDGFEHGILEAMEAADGAAAAVAQAKEAQARVAAAVAEDIAEVDRREAKVTGRLAEVGAEIERIRAAADGDALAIFDRVVSVRNGIGVAEMHDGACSACQVHQRPQLALEVQKMQELRQCEHCKRVLYLREALELSSDVSVASD